MRKIYEKKLVNKALSVII